MCQLSLAFKEERLHARCRHQITWPTTQRSVSESRWIIFPHLPHPILPAVVDIFAYQCLTQILSWNRTLDETLGVYTSDIPAGAVPHATVLWCQTWLYMNEWTAIKMASWLSICLLDSAVVKRNHMTNSTLFWDWVVNIICPIDVLVESIREAHCKILTKH